MEPITWDTVAERIVADDVGKWDRALPANRIRITPKNALIEATNGSGLPDTFTLSDAATNQVCERLGIPVAYYRRLPPEMRATVANFDLHRMGERAFLLRGKSAHVRAFLSSDYIAYDNRQIAETVEELLRSEVLRIRSFVLEETHCYLKIVSEELVEPTAGLKAGIMIGNSEVGMGSISVEPFVFRKACTNDLVVAAEKSFRHVHLHFTPHELSRRMAEAIGYTFVVATQLLDAFLKSREDPIPDPVAAIRKLAEARKLSQKLVDEVVGRYVAEPEPNRFGLINAFTGAAQTLAPLQRIELERFAGGLLNGRP